MRKKIKLRLSSVLFVSACFLTLFLSLFLFWKNLNRMTVRNDILPIGTIEYKYKIAQRKFVDRVAWERLQQNASLYNGDTIRTADGALARLFIDNAQIEIHESTMVQIFYNPETGVNLSVDSGNISVDSTSAENEVAIHFSNGQQFVMEAGSKILAQSGDINNLVVQSGVVSYEDKNGEVSVINSGETVVVKDEGTVEKVPVSITSISDDVHLLSFDNSPKSVLLEWKLNDNTENHAVVVETSLTKDFSSVLNTYLVDNKNSINLESPVGKIYWKAYLKDDKNNAISGKITVDSVNPVDLLSPAMSWNFQSKQGKENVNFSWKGNSLAAYYLLEVATSSDFKNPIVSNKFYGTYANINDLAEGQYFWRVTPYYLTNNIGYGKESVTGDFRISKLQYSKPPVLSIPADNTKITIYENGSDVNFIWKSFTQDNSYRLLIAKDESFNTIVYTRDVEGSSKNQHFLLNQLPEGNYYWKVVSLTEKDENDKYLESAYRKFSTIKYVPGENKLVYPPDKFTVELKQLAALDFSWKMADEYKSDYVGSVIQISKSSDFSSLALNKKVSGLNVSNLSMPNGEYWWRAGIELKNGDVVYTKANLIKILEELGTPDIIFPASNSMVSLERENTIFIQWKNVSGADYYTVKVFDGSKQYDTKTVKNNSVRVTLPPSLFDSKLNASLSCSVQAASSENELTSVRTSKVSETSFSVRKPSPIVLTNPVEGSQILGLVAMRNPVKFYWSTTESSVESNFILKKMEPSGAMTTIKNIPTHNQSVEVSGLQSGTYEWSIKATSKEGFVLDSEKSFTFTILPVPELASPGLIQPYSQQTIDGNYLVTNKAVNFKWNKVAEATDYSFVLYQRLSNGRLKQIVSKNTRQNTYKFSDLTSLDIGSFEWHVTAYVHGSGGREEQKSKASIGRFKIDFGIPDQVETIDPGKMYGE